MAEPRSNDEGYRIYLIGFPEIAGDAQSAPVASLIGNIVPEAEILYHDIFRTHGVSYSVNTLEESQAAAIKVESYGFVASAEPISTKNRVESTEYMKLTPNEPSFSSDGYNEPHNENTRSDVPGESESITSSVSRYCFSAKSIRDEALLLLDRIQRDTPMGRSGNITLAGYGLGGLVVKEAIVVANTIPVFYNITLDVTSLIFFAAPHRPNRSQSWEQTLLELGKEANGGHEGQLFQNLSELVNYVSHLSLDFYQFASKYHIAHFVRHGNGEGKCFKCDNEIEKIAVWAEGGPSGFSIRATDNLENLIQLRKHFAPLHILSGQHKDAARDLEESSAQRFRDAYFETLRAFSQSRYIIYQIKSLVRQSDLHEMRNIYSSFLSYVSVKKACDGSIQVTGSPGRGQPNILNLIVQKLVQESPVVILENLDINPDQAPKHLYPVYVSFIHQIFSQRPSLFRYSQNLVSHIIRQKVWATEPLRHLLQSIFLQAKAVHFLVVIHDWDTWSDPVRCWWQEMFDTLARADLSAVTFVISSRKLIEFPNGKQLLHLDLDEKYNEFKESFITSRLDYHLVRTYGTSFLSERHSEKTRMGIAKKARSFNGTFYAIDKYLGYLFDSFTLSTPRMIQEVIDHSPCTELELYRGYVRLLSGKPTRIVSWAAIVVSWVMQATRPIHIEELAVAIALTPDVSSMTEIHQAMPLSLEKDIKDHLSGLLVIENRLVRVTSLLVRGALVEDRVIGDRLETDSSITLRCLHYLEVVLGSMQNEMWRNCVTYTPSEYNGRNSPEPVLEFLNYACRFWPVHFLQVGQPDENLKEQVAKFLQTDAVAGRWFDLYLHSTNLPPSPFVVNSMEPKASTKDNTIPYPKPTAAQMASYVGLSSVTLLLHGIRASEDPEIEFLRQGRSERAVVLRDLPLVYRLECSIANDDYEIVESLLTRDPEKSFGCFPLHTAASAGSLKTLQVLSSLLDNPTELNEDKRNALHMAAICGSIDIVRFFFSKEDSNGHVMARLQNAQDLNGQTPLILAIRMGHTEAVRLLVESGTTLMVRDERGRSALHYAIADCRQAIDILLDKEKEVVLVKDERGSTPLHIAVQCGDTESTSRLLNAANTLGRRLELVNALDNDQRTPLHVACEYGWPHVAEILMDRGADISIPDKKKHLPADLAAQHGHLGAIKTMARTDGLDWERLITIAAITGQLLLVKYILQQVVPHGHRELVKQNALLAAASAGYNAIVITLLQHGAKADLAGSLRQTALHHAAINGKIQIVRTLLADQSWKGDVININAPDYRRETALHMAAKGGYANIITLLLNYERDKVDKAARSREGQTPLHVAVEHPKVVELLLDAKVDIDSCDDLGQTALHKASQKKCLESARLLLRRGADVTIRDVDDNPALFYAIDQNDMPMTTELFLADKNISKKTLWKCLELSIKGSKLDLLKFLVKNSPDALSTTNGAGYTLFCLAARRGSTDILTFLRDGSNINYTQIVPLHQAIYGKQLKNIKLLIEWGVEVDHSDTNGYTALHLAAQGGFNDAISTLLENGASINNQGPRKQTPLFRAAWCGETQAVELLVQAGADVNLQREDGWSPLHAAADNLEITQFLIGKNANVHCKNEDYDTPLHLSASWIRSSPDITLSYLKNGADPNVENRLGDTPFFLALKKGNYGAVKAMLNHHGDNMIDINRRNGKELTPLHLAVLEKQTQIIRVLIDCNSDLEAKTAEGRSCLELAVEGNDSVLLRTLLGEVEDDAAGTTTPKPSWPMQYMVDAYWAAIERAQVRNIEILVKWRRQLLEEVSNAGFNGLETCLRSLDSFGSEGEDKKALAIRLVELGINPFEHRGGDAAQSAFANVFSQLEANEIIGFVGECAKYLDRSSLRFEDTRIMIEINISDWIAKLGRLDASTHEESDQDGWTMEHVLYQSAPRLRGGRRETKPATTFKTPTSIIWPQSWRTAGTSGKVSLDGLKASLEDSFKIPFDLGTVSPEYAICLRADFPFPPRLLGPSYFEVTIDTEMDGNEPTTPAHSGLSSESEPIVNISVGLCGEFLNRKRSLPGWELWSIGYHGGDGKIFEGRFMSRPRVFGTGHRFGPGQTIGCGVDYERKIYFFTVDGVVIADRHINDIIFRKLYPCIGHAGSKAKVVANFGGSPFAWHDAQKLSPEPFKMRKSTTWDRSEM